MKLKFKKQAYQTNAVEAVANCFAGQPINSGIQYRVDPGRLNTGEQQTCQSALKSIHLTASNNVQQLNKVSPFSAPFYAA